MANLTPEEKQRRKEERRKLKWEKEHKIIDGIGHKICSICQEFQPATTEYFYKNDKNSLDGLSPRCKECEKKKAMEWKRSHPEKWKKNNKTSNALPSVKAIKRKSEQTRREEGKVLEWQQKNRDKLKKYNQKRSNKNHNINNQEWIACKNYFDNKCAYCGLPQENHWIERKGRLINMELHKEHVMHNGENDLSNCVPSCQECNSEKHDFLFEDWYKITNIKYTEERHSKIQKWLQEDYKKYIITDKKPKQKYNRKKKQNKAV